MQEIIELDDILSNKIAAGEVVERPASVIKELVENAIDAKSTVVEIDIEEAGLSMIRVIDNGKGIGEKDIASAFKRHATSKIKDEHDLFRIRSLGFRGEALPSIASVSRIEIVSANKDEQGTKLIIEGGYILSREKAAARTGTDITVRDLFFNTPARLKYVKTIHTEVGHITDVVNRLAMAHPHISMRLRHNNRVLLHTNGNGDTRQVLAAIYGINVAREMIEIKANSLDFTLTGFISLPEMTRASRNYVSTIVNGRFIKNYSLVHSILEGYHTLLPVKRYPIGLLSIQMDPLLVDVNVHPAKLEVRLSKERELHEMIVTTIKKAFQKQQLIPKGTAPMTTSNETIQTKLKLEQSVRDKNDVKEPNFTYNKEKLLPVQEMKRLYEPSEQPETVEVSSSNEQPIVVQRETLIERDDDQVVETELGERIPRLDLIGQMHGTYILAQNEQGLYMIDQHAAQERIKYEFFREKVSQVANEYQQLLVPLTLQFSGDEYIRIVEYKDVLKEVGIVLEEFGKNSFIVRSHPIWFPQGEEKKMIEEMIEQVLTMSKVDLEKLREEVAIMMSCKAAIKANRFLRDDEIQALLDQLRYTENPFTCPHGRPVMIQFTVNDIEKMFKRIM